MNESPTETHVDAACEMVPRDHLQPLQRLTAGSHDPTSCSPWLGTVCPACAIALEQRIADDAARFSKPASAIRLFALLRGLRLLDERPAVRPAAVGELQRVRRERDAALALVGHLARLLPAAALRQVLAALEVRHPELADGLRLARLTAQRAAVEAPLG